MPLVRNQGGGVGRRPTPGDIRTKGIRTRRPPGCRRRHSHPVADAFPSAGEVLSLPGGLPRMRGNELAHLRIDLFAPAAAAEDAVVPGALDGQVLAVAFGHAGAQLVRGAGLAFAGDVVELAFDGHQRGVADRRRLRSEEHTSELQSLMRNSYAVF